MQTLAIFNNKGGVAKTTTAVSLAAAFARLGHRTLLLDLDGQANASFSLGVGRNALTPSSADVLIEGLSLRKAVRQTSVDRLELVTGSMALANADLSLGDVRGRETRLRDALATVRGDYTFTVLDCPPSLSLLPINALVACDAFLVPVVPQYLSLEGLVSLLEAVDRIRKGMGVSAKMLGLVVTMADYRVKATTEIIGMLREHYGSAVCGPEIRVNARLAEAPSHGQTIFEYDSSSSGAEAYAMLAREVIGRCRRDVKTEGRKAIKAEDRKAGRAEVRP